MQEIYVFGSNLAGKHGAGSARVAKNCHGAIYGQGVGRQGNAYAIPTKDANLRPLPLDRVDFYVQEFLIYAYENPQLTFRVVDIGCGLAEYKPYQIASMFSHPPANVVFIGALRNLVKR